MADTLTEFDYLLNRFEHASQSGKPVENKYGEHRRALYAHVRDLEAKAAQPAPRGSDACGSGAGCLHKLAQIDTLSERLALAEDNAARYRWLRDIGDATWRPFGLREGYSAAQADAAIDAAIDAARAGKEPT